MLRILSISASPPYPPDHGVRLRAWRLLDALANQADVHVLTWAEGGFSAEHIRMVASRVALTVLPVTTRACSLAERARRHARFLAGGSPPYAQEQLVQRGLASNRGRAELVTHVARLHEATPFDVIVLEEESLATFPLPDLGVPLVVHRLNVFGDVISDLRTSGDRLTSMLTATLELSAWRRYDRLVMRGADLAVALTDESRSRLKHLSPPTEVCIVPNGVQPRPLATRPGQGTDLAFVGWMGYPPNVDAVRWFTKSAWPAVHARWPATRFRIIGREPSRSVSALAAVAGVDVVGEVADIVEACRGVRAGLVPLRTGMGMKNKTLEFMGMGLPVICLPAGAEGIGAKPDDGLLVCDDRDGLTAAVDQLLMEGGTADRLGEAASAFVQSHHSWTDIAAQYLAHLERISVRHKATRPGRCA